MKNITKGLAAAVTAGVFALYAIAFYLRLTLPDQYYVSYGEDLKIPSRFSVQADMAAAVQDLSISRADSPYTVGLKLLDTIPVKEVQVQVVDRRMIIPGGIPFGIKMFTQGVMIVGMSDIQIGSSNINPSKEAGLKVGDILLEINDEEVSRNDEVKEHILSSEGNEIKLTVMRSGETMDYYLQPVKTDYDNTYKAGIWVRDSSAGIGTMTYYDPVTLTFAGLGHAICDVDTGRVMPLSSGEIVDVNISGSNIGQSGKPGELKGTFSGLEPIGYLYRNTEMGIFGTLANQCIDTEPIPMAYKQEIKPGPAVILSTISGNKPQQFDIMIEKVNYSDTSDTKNMIIRIVDDRLLAATGGIVQGMSGSPIIQDGKLAGAVTHVFVNDPTRGYSIFAENMDKQLKNINSSENQAVNY